MVDFFCQADPAYEKDGTAACIPRVDIHSAHAKAEADLSLAALRSPPASQMDLCGVTCAHRMSLGVGSGRIRIKVGGFFLLFYVRSM